MSRLRIYRFSFFRTCRFCRREKLIIVEDKIDTTVDDASKDIGLAIDAAVEAEGWKAGACPNCSITHRKHLLNEKRAEDFIIP